MRISSRITFYGLILLSFIGGTAVFADWIENFENHECLALTTLDCDSWSCYTEGERCPSCSADEQQSTCNPTKQGVNCVRLIDEDGCGVIVDGTCVIIGPPPGSGMTCAQTVTTQDCPRLVCNDDDP